MDVPARPAIPMRLAARPTVGGVVVPWVNVQLGDGGVDFRRAHHSRWVACWRRGLCQLCGQPLTHPRLLVGSDREMRAGFFSEPPLHPECAVYASRACPMLAGRQPRFRVGPSISDGHRGATCFEPGCGCAGWVPTPGAAGGREGEPAPCWYAVYVADYALGVWPDETRPGLMRVTGGRPEGDPLRVRLISAPGRGRVWETVHDYRRVAGWAADHDDGGEGHGG